MLPAGFRQRAQALVEEGRKRLGLTMGIVSHISDERYEIIAVSSSQGVFVPGEAFALQDTYCRDVIKQGRTLALTEIDGLPGLRRHPLYDALPLEAYISSPIMVAGSVWGTINFSCMVPRDHAFNDAEIQFVEAAAGELGELLSQKDAAQV